jgi:signal transduction histidine kinase
MFRPLFYLILLLLPLCSIAQDRSLVEVPGVPSREIYDLLRAHNGHIWIAHNSGISRYDGLSFISFGNPQQNGRAMTDLVEDGRGRIWCHNFEGQIFYLEKQRLNLFKPYHFENEKVFPRIGILGDELVATSSRGLFVSNTNGSSSRIYPLPDQATSLSVLPNGVLVMVPGSGFWWYQKNKGIRQLDARIKPQLNNTYALQPEPFGDTAFLIENPPFVYYKAVVKADSLVISDSVPANNFINAVSVDGNEYWVHTMAYSYSNKGRVLRNQQLTCAVNDRQGHYFFSSIKKGLLVEQQAYAKRVEFPFLMPEELVRAILPTAPNEFLFGTSSGGIFLVRNGKAVASFRLNPESRQVNAIIRMDVQHYMIMAAMGVFRLDLKLKKISPIETKLAVKDCYYDAKRTVFATHFGMLTSQTPPLYISDTIRNSFAYTYNNIRRCRSVCQSPNGYLYAAFSNGLFLSRRPGDTSFPQLGGTRLYATRVRNFAGRVLIGTFNKGLLLHDSAGFHPITAALEGHPNSVPDIKVSGQTAWILYDREIQELDTNFHLRERLGLPFGGEDVWDIIEEGDHLLVTTSKGLYSVPRTPPRSGSTHTLIDNVLVEGLSDSAAQSGRFPARNNTVTIKLSTPWFAATGGVRYHYRLRTTENEGWLLSDENQSSFTFVNLGTGSYTFEAEALNVNGTALTNSVSYSFQIEPAWYQTWWARLAAVIALVTSFYFIGRNLQRRKSRRERVLYEKKLAVEQERNRISAEIHDDLGASLSGVRLQAELLRDKMPADNVRGEMDNIHNSIGLLTGKIREVIWTLNTDYDTLESLMLYIEKTAQTLFAASPIRLLVRVPVNTPSLNLRGDFRRQVYLAVKEALHNCLKHSKASLCQLQFEYTDSNLRIDVIDDGAGLSHSKTAFASGMNTMRKRMETIGGKLEIKQHNGLCITFQIPLDDQLHESTDINR